MEKKVLQSCYLLNHEKDAGDGWENPIIAQRPDKQEFSPLKNKIRHKSKNLVIAMHPQAKMRLVAIPAALCL